MINTKAYQKNKSNMEVGTGGWGFPPLESVLKKTSSGLERAVGVLEEWGAGCILAATSRKTRRPARKPRASSVVRHQVW